jgi:beta-barrel assembly-enhancing protease
MRFFRPLAYFATLSLVVSLAPAVPAAIFAAETGEATGVLVEAYRANLLTQYEERIVGQRLAYLYEERHTLLTDVETQTRLNRIITRLSKVLPSDQALEVKIIRSARPEAVSFPPGRIYITSALVKLAPTDDALAAVIAHEAAHIEDRHLARLIALTLTLPPVEQGLFPTRRAIITGQVLQFAFPSVLDEARLRCEMEADQLARQKLERAGYRTEALAILLESLNARPSAPAGRERAAMQARITSLREQPLLSLR